MRKNFGSKTAVYPMPVFIVAAYDAEGKANAMNAAWGGISEDKEISVCLSEDHKTTENILCSKACTVSMAPGIKFPTSWKSADSIQPRVSLSTLPLLKNFP